MTQQWDIVLAGNGYMVARGSYRRGLDAAGGLGGPPVRQVQRDWRGGAGRALQAERDCFWSSVGLLPVAQAGGVGPGPLATSFTVAGLDPLARRYGAVLNGRPYVAAGSQLWRPERADAGAQPENLASFTPLGAALPQVLTGLCTDGYGHLYLSRAGAGYVSYLEGAASLDTTPTVELTGCAWYAGSLWGATHEATGWRVVRVTGASSTEATTWPLDSAPRSWATLRDGLYIGTGGGLWRVRGTVTGGAFSGEVTLLASSSGEPDDYCALVEYQGDLYTWVGGAVQRYHSGAGSSSTLRPVGLSGGRCRGLAVAQGKLFASVTPPVGQGPTTLWAFDGVGWWAVGRDDDGLHQHSWPLPTAGYFTNAALLSFGLGSNRAYGWQLLPATNQPGLAASGELVTSLWHGRDPDKEKSWLRVGAELAWPAAQSFAACTVSLAVATDGSTFITLGSASVSTSTARTLAFDLPANSNSKWLSLRYQVSGVSSGAPTLAALWAEYRPLEVPKRRRHWVFDILAADDVTARNGAHSPRNGAAIAADLWAAWESGATLAFRDLDYDLAPVTYAVRIVGLDEQIAAPADAGRWAESRLRLRLVAV